MAQTADLALDRQDMEDDPSFPSSAESAATKADFDALDSSGSSTVLLREGRKLGDHYCQVRNAQCACLSACA